MNFFYDGHVIRFELCTNAALLFIDNEQVDAIHGLNEKLNHNISFELHGSIEDAKVGTKNITAVFQENSNTDTVDLLCNGFRIDSRKMCHAEWQW